MDPDRVLRGEAGLAGVRSLVHGSGRSALRRALQPLAGRGSDVRSLQVQRVHFKPGAKLAVYYDAELGPAREVVPVAVTWYAQPHDPDPRLATADAALAGRGVDPAFAHHWIADGSGKWLVQIAPLDPVFPALADLADPGGAARLGLRAPARAASLRFVRYRPGQRHLLHWRDGVRGGELIKLYRPGEAPPIAEAAEGFARAADSVDSTRVRVVRPALVLVEQDALVYAGESGTPLSRSLRSRPQNRLECLVDVGRWLAAIHRLPVAAGGPFRRRGLDEEAARALRACAAMRALDPNLFRRAEAIVGEAAQRLSARPSEDAPALVHGDAKADHLLCGDGRVVVLDTDSCAIADPALDLGKLLADLRWWTSYREGSPVTAAELALLAGYRPGSPRLARARLYAAMLLARMAGRRVSPARMDWTARTELVLDLGARLLCQDTALLA